MIIKSVGKKYSVNLKTKSATYVQTKKGKFKQEEELTMNDTKKVTAEKK